VLALVISLITGTAQPAHSDGPAKDPALNVAGAVESPEAPLFSAVLAGAEDEDWVPDPEIRGLHASDDKFRILFHLTDFGRFQVVIDRCTGEMRIVKTVLGIDLTYHIKKDNTGNWLLTDFFGNRICRITKDADGSVTFTCGDSSYRFSFDPTTGEVCYPDGDETICEDLPRLRKLFEKLKDFYWCPYLTPAPPEGAPAVENEDEGWDSPMCMGLTERPDEGGGSAPPPSGTAW